MDLDQRLLNQLTFNKRWKSLLIILELNMVTSCMEDVELDVERAGGCWRRMVIPVNPPTVGLHWRLQILSTE